MVATTSDPVPMAAHQESDYGVGREYEHGSPHLTHAHLRERIRGDLRAMVVHQLALRGGCRVLEIGGGHGSFTRDLVDAGASVVVTEMSGPSAARLEQEFGARSDVTVAHDPEGAYLGQTAPGSLDLVVFASVLHHIPDYLRSVSDAIGALGSQGSLFTVQDPLLYSRVGRSSHGLHRGAYFAWRAQQGDLRQGVRTRLRRLRHEYDPAEPSDMIEYHVVRDGVDEAALRALLEPAFALVEEWHYWSTQSAALQRAGELAGLTSTFGLRAHYKK